MIGRDATRVLLGDERLDSGIRHGACLSVLHWLDDAQSIGAEVSFVGIGGDNTAYSAASTGLPILARPFHNEITGAEHAELVAYPNVVEGVVTVDTSSELLSGSALLRRSVSGGGTLNVDMIGGYRFFRYREGFGVTENLVSRDPQGGVQIGTNIDLHDAFDAETDFHGGEIGLAIEAFHGPFSLDVATKLGIGGVSQRIDIDGYTTVTTPGDPPSTAQGGLLALSSNMDLFTRHRFALLPELDFRLSCLVLDRLTVSVGYRLICLTETVRTGDQIDYHVNPTLLPNNTDPVTGDLRPVPQLKSTLLWVQGISVGGVFEF